MGQHREDTGRPEEATKGHMGGGEGEGKVGDWDMC